MKKQHAQKKLLKCLILKMEKNYLDYTIKVMSFLLADVFEKFVKVSTEEYGSSPLIA